MMIAGIVSMMVLVPAQTRGPIIHPGWADEMNVASHWKPLGLMNQAKMSVPKRGALRLELAAVPAGWAYEYQWSGAAQRARVDIARFPVLMARVESVQGYAHMDIDVLDATGKKVKGFRSSTVTGPGVCVIDLGKELDPAKYTLGLRLIVGGPNSGCFATYNWVRFVSMKDAEFLTANPDYARVAKQ